MQKYLRTREAAAYVGLSARTLEGKRVDGTGPKFRRLGGRGAVIYDVADLVDWIESAPAVRSTTELAQLAGAA